MKTYAYPRFVLKPLSLLLAAFPVAVPVFAQEANLAETIVTARKTGVTAPGDVLPMAKEVWEPLRAAAGDTAALLRDVPGVSVYGAGGVSSLPAIQGLADDRLRIKVDGMDLISACANHMNPPLSYIDPSQVGSVKVFAGITPVSVGGDSIGGTIAVSSPAPEFSGSAQEILKRGQLGAFYRSNGSATGGNIHFTVASDSLSLAYDGSHTEAGNYKVAANFKAAGAAATGRGWLNGDVVGSSAYRAENHALRFALRHENHLFELKAGLQEIPFQGFPNQRMDMTGNHSTQFNLRYRGVFDWGNLDARVYNERTRHQMQFGNDKAYWYGTAPGMPMDTAGNNTGATVKAEIALGEQDLLRLGSDYQRYRLNDWWLPSGTGGMSPLTFWNINNGQRDRFDLFGEWEKQWNAQWESLLGIRSGQVTMNTGAVQGYCDSTNVPINNVPPCTDTRYLNTANAFNALDRQRTDHNLDLTALARYAPGKGRRFEFGYAQKTRSPNLYERYTWSTGSTMVLNMNNWVGDGNGYVGNPNLRPETAHILSATASWHDAENNAWALKVSPHYTRVDGYIDAVACPSCAVRTDGFANLTLANQNARLYGVDISGHMPIGTIAGYSGFSAKGWLSYVNGKNLTTGSNLYNIMPLNVKLAVTQRIGAWSHTIEGQWVDAKTDVSTVRREQETGGYGLFHLRGSYEWQQARLDLGVENLFNKFYYHPLGGAYVGQGSTMGTGVPYGTLVPGMGRSIYTALNLKF